MIYTYTRTGNGLQTIEAQTEQIEQYVSEKGIKVNQTFTDEIKDGKAPAFAELKALLKENDTLIITDIDRISRDWETVMTEYIELINQRINLIVTQYDVMNIDVSTFNKTVTQVEYLKKLAEVYCFSITNERRKISETTRSALANLQLQGIKLGRPQKYDHETIIDMYLEGKTYQFIMDKTGASRAMISKIVKRNGIQRRRPNGYKKLD